MPPISGFSPGLAQRGCSDAGAIQRLTWLNSLHRTLGRGSGSPASVFLKKCDGQDRILLSSGLV